MKEVSLCDLPRWSTWPARLLGLASWTKPCRTVEKVKQEYDQGKYAELLAFYQNQGGNLTPDEIERHNYGLDAEHRWCVSVGNRLYEVSLAEARDQYYSLLCDTLRPFEGICSTVVELGAGYGYNLWMLKQRLKFSHYLGGEYSENAVRLAGLAYKNNPEIKVFSFNYYDPETYRFLETAPGPVVLFTSHSLEQIPCSDGIFENLHRYRNRIHKVFHFEPAYQLYDGTLLGQMRTRYTQLNHYNNDLLEQLRKRSFLRIDDIKPNVYGLNVFNPTSVISWSFTRNPD